MLHAATSMAGLLLCWLIFTQAWNSPAEWTAAAASAVGVTIYAMRFGGAGAAFTRAPHLVRLALTRSGAVLAGAFRVVRAAAAADVKLRPALMRIKTRARDATVRSALASALCAAPGAVVVDGDAESLLAHVLDEDEAEAAQLAKLEAAMLIDGWEARS